MQRPPLEGEYMFIFDGNGFIGLDIRLHSQMGIVLTRFYPVDFRVDLVLKVSPVKVSGLLEDGQMTGLDMFIGHSNQVPPMLPALGDIADRLGLPILVYSHGSTNLLGKIEPQMSPGLNIFYFAF
jgi:hypothetical protein